MPRSRKTRHASGTLGGSLLSRIPLVLLRHTLFINTRRRARPDSKPERMGLAIALVKTPVLDTGASRRNENRAPMSSGLFWSGVPVRHQRCRVESAKHALMVIEASRGPGGDESV